MVADTFLCFPTYIIYLYAIFSLCSLDAVAAFYILLLSSPCYSKLTYVEFTTGLSRTHLNFVMVLVKVAAVRMKLQFNIYLIY